MICNLQITKGHQFEVRKVRNIRLYSSPSDQTTFLRMVELMLSPNQEIAGCPCQFPESVFFADGKPLFVGKTDKKYEGNM